MAALPQRNRRGIIALGAGATGLPDIPDYVFAIESAPHSELFKHVSGTVHHGGAGTLAASLQAGVPTAIYPFFGDQPFWARCAEQLGIAPAPLARAQAGVDQFAAALDKMADPAVIARAGLLGGKIRAEDGLSAAADFIESMIL